jgi:hypothetical protein
MQLVSRFAQAHDSLQRSRDLSGTPVIRAETSWLWFNRMLRANAVQLDPDTRTSLHIHRALETTVRNQLSWLGNVPPEALVEIRNVGALEEIRSIIGGGLKELVSAEPNNFHGTGDRVFGNLNSAFRDHERQLKLLSAKRWKFAGRDVSSFVLVGGIEVAAAITGLPMYGVLAAFSSLSGVVPTAKELREKLRELREEQRHIDATGVGILLRSRS